MALGKIKEGKRVTFEGDFYLQGFEIVPASNNYSSYGLYQLGTEDGRSLSFTGWTDSGCEKLEKNKLYHFYFDYDSRYKNSKPRVIGCEPNFEFQLVKKDEPININM